LTHQKAKIHERSQEENNDNSYVESLNAHKRCISFKPDNKIQMETKKMRPHRALVLQGGGALGAYEAGVFKALMEKITKEDETNGEINRPLFDIVAGSSIGAANAAILVSYVVQNKNW
jgi:Patatin-like phospholipase